MAHPNTALLAKIYSKFVEGNVDGFLNDCPDSMTFQIAGKSKLAGKFNKTNFKSDYFKKMNELSLGTYKFEIHDILASDLHATVLGTVKATVNSKNYEIRTVHVWRLDQGQPIAGYEYPRDLYQFDLAWGS